MLGQRRYRVLLFVTVLLAALMSLETASGQPHGGYGSSTNRCDQCHAAHNAAGGKLFVKRDQKQLCYSCHDGTSSVYDARAEFGESSLGSSTMRSHHPVPDGVLLCDDCHTPHRGPAEGNPMSLSGGASRVETGSAVCGSCHGSGSTLPGGDHLTPLVGTPHEEDVAAPRSGSGVKCLACHVPHGSTNAALVATAVADSFGVTRTVDTSAGVNPLCLTCHAAASTGFPGETTYGLVKHATARSSTVATTTYAGSGAVAGECRNCHEPHGRGSGDAYTRSAGNELCRSCHDVAGVTYPAGYSYRGGTRYDAGAHASVTTTVGYSDLFSDSSGFAAWESTSLPTPASPGRMLDAGRLRALRYVDATMAVTSLAESTGDMDYQTYRFKMPVDNGDLRQLRLRWTGFGEDVPGYETTVSVWDTTLGGGSGDWSPLRHGVYGDTTTVSVDLPVGPSSVSGAGYLYAMVSVRHATKATILSGPVVSEATTTSAKITWTTLGRSTSWVDIGPDALYGGTFGSAEMTTTHQVIVPLPAAGVYHFRVRSADVEGVLASSVDQAFGAPGPVTNVVGPDLPNITSIVFSWSDVPEALRAPYTYQLSVRASNGAVTSYPWQATTTQTVTLGYDTWTWWVTAKDKDGQVTARSAERTFTNYYYDPSCPILYTWDGSSWRFITDVMGFGTLGVKQGTGYRWPPPVEESRIDPDALVDDHGSYRLKLANEKAEIEFIDQVKLRAVDHPAGTNVYLNDYTRSGTTSYTPDWRIYTTRDERPVASASYTDVPLYSGPGSVGVDVTDALSRADGVYAPAWLFDDNQYVFDLGDLRDAPEIKLVVNGWTQYATPAERTAWEQSGAAAAKRVLEVQDADGNWVVVDSRLPFIPGYTKSVVYDLTGKFPAGVTRYRVRMRGFYRTWLDSVKVDTSRTEPVTVTDLSPSSAQLGFKGVSRYSAEPMPIYSHDDVITRTPPQQQGMFTKFGDVLPLLGEPDDMFVVMDSGDELSLSFPASQPAAGKDRTFLLHGDGYFQELTGKVDPMPFHAMSNYPYSDPEHYPDDAAHVAYLTDWNTRRHPDTATADPAPGGITALVARAAAFVESLLGIGGTAPAPAEVPRSVHTDSVSLQVAYRKPSTVAAASCNVCHAVHGQPQADGTAYPALLAEDEARTCTGSGLGGCHSSAANAADGVDVYARVTASTPSARHDVTPEAKAASGSKLACSSCHDPHKETARDRFSNPDSISETVTAPANDYLGPNGDVYVLVGAEHDGAAPVMSNVRIDNTTPTVPAVLWSTDESSTSWVDLGETTSYELGSYGATLPIVLEHRVPSRELTPGVTYHYRLRSADALGNERISADATLSVAYPPPAPVLSPVASLYGYLPQTVVATWTPVATPDGDAAQYYAEMWDTSTYGGPYLKYTSGWSSSTTWTLNAYFSGNAMIRVKARDAVHKQAEGAWSNESTFTITVPSGTCPYLFTFDGSKPQFECDLYGTGKLGMKSSGRYLMPQPEDALLLRTEPAEVDGAYDLRLVEERLEVDYLDQLKLYSVDTLAGRDVVTEMPTLGEAPLSGIPGIIHTVAHDIHGAPAVHVQTGEDVTGLLDASDGRYVVLNDDRNADFTYQTVELDLSSTAGAPQTKLVIDGRTLFPDSPAGTARSSTFGKRTKLDVQMADGTWRSVPSTELVLPKPMEFEKPYVVDLTRVLEGSARKVRLTFLFKTFLDSVRVDTTLDEPVRITEVPMLSAELRRHGFDGMTGSGELYEYDYGAANGESQYFPGDYTHFGDVTPLLDKTDDRFVVYGGGDELALRFAVALPPTPGMERRWMVTTHGYYKDTKTDLPRTVEPLPFSGMSAYPYPSTESYPTDGEHAAYLAEWNTRTEPSPTPPAAGTPVTVGEGTTRVVAEPAGSFSLDSDAFSLASNGLGRAPFTYAAAAGWESVAASTTPPTPASPGNPVDASTLSRVSSADASYWRSDSTTTDRRWNWQLVRFSIPAADLARVSELRAKWTGHGEPTRGYRTTLSFWNHRTRAWEATFALDAAGEDTSIARSGTSVPSATCLACHDGTPPSGVTVPVSVANIGASWSSALHSNAATSAGSGGGLIPEYRRGRAPDVQCATCHDPHGSANVWHFPTTVKDKTGIAVPNGTQTANLCNACHTGTPADWHYGGCSCHYNWGDDPSHSPGDFWTGSDCTSCHGHGRTYEHRDCHGCHPGPWKTL